MEVILFFIFLVVFIITQINIAGELKLTREYIYRVVRSEHRRDTRKAFAIWRNIWKK